MYKHHHYHQVETLTLDIFILRLSVGALRISAFTKTSFLYSELNGRQSESYEPSLAYPSNIEVFSRQPFDQGPFQMPF